jgi:hypothetical protein
MFAPSVRIRPFEIDHSTNWMTQAVDWHARTKELPAYLDTVWTSDGETPWMVALDLIGIGESLAGGVTVTRIENTPLN